MEKRLIAFLILVAVVVGCSSKSSSPELDYELEVTETRNWPATNINQIASSTVNGNISISASQGNTITVDITRKCLGEDSADAAQHLDNIVITEDTMSSILTLDADMPINHDRNYSASFDFASPESLYLNPATTNGNITITNMTGGADVSITNGDIATVNMQGGIDGETVNGSIDCDLALLDPSESAVLTTTNGTVTLSLPIDVSASFDAQTENGTVTVTGFSNVNYTTNEQNHKAGTIGSGLASINITVTNGDIVIQAR